MRRLCVKRFTILVVLMVLLLAGGGLTSLLIASSSQVLPILQQVAAPDASPTTMLPWKANQFFILIAFALFNLIGMAVTIAIVIWVIDWGLKRSKADAADAKQQAAEPAAQTE
jgi:hypothetical protein